MAKKNNTNWIKLYRSLMDNEIWSMEPFTRGQAWVDLLMMVCYEDTDNLHRGNLVHLSKGSTRTSIAYLAKRWHRSDKWVRHTLEILKGMDMVQTIGTTQGTIITIKNYTSFQGQGQTKGQTEDRATDRAKGRHNKNVKERKEIADGENGTINESVSPPPAQERYSKVIDYTTGRVLIYDNKEERYIDG